MTRRILLAAVGIMLATAIWAVPAKRGVKHTITLKNGTTIEATLQGDEHTRYYQDQWGNCYVAANDGVYELKSKEEMQHLFSKGLQKKSLRDHKTMQKVGEDKDHSIFRGQRRGLIMLANFTDQKFSMSDPKALYTRIANEKGYSEGRFRGSVHDYFYDNSYGKFDMEFDIVGPIELAHNMAYYGANQGNDDIRPAEMIKECLEAADSQVNYRDYDWDGDGEVDQVFVVYAGYNEAQGGNSNTIWPHMWTLRDGLGTTLKLDGVTLNTYACSSELMNNSGNEVDGIGTICHEFSHCMGFPDLYDTGGGSCFGMNDWSLMSSGNYNGDGFCPAAYTSYERMVCGWLTPIELTDPVNIKGMKGLTEGGESYIIYGDNTRRTEYYLLENRQPTLWDSALPGKGLLILHVDYNRTAWTNNLVNTTTYSYYNKHQRLTIFHADNNEGGYHKHADAGDTYPYGSNNSWTSTSTPAATQYNGGDNASKLNDREVTNITLNSNGTIDFTYRLADSDATTYKSLFLDELSETPQQIEEGTFNVHTNRLFASNKWESLWLPFSITDQQMKEIFGRRAEVAVFTGASTDSGTLNFEITTDGIPAYTPLIIKVITGDELNDVGNMMQMNVVANNDEINMEKDGFSFIGSRVMKPIDNNIFYINNDYFANSTPKDMSSDDSQDIQPEELLPQTVKIVKALQAYIKNESIDRPALKIAIDGEILNDDIENTYPDDSTGIAETIEFIHNNDVYTLQGVRTNRTNMHKGIYIIGGKKVVVKQ